MNFDFNYFWFQYMLHQAGPSAPFLQDMVFGCSMFLVGLKLPAVDPELMLWVDDEETFLTYQDLRSRVDSSGKDVRVYKSWLRDIIHPAFDPEDVDDHYSQKSLKKLFELGVLRSKLIAVFHPNGRFTRQEVYALTTILKTQRTTFKKFVEWVFRWEREFYIKFDFTKKGEKNGRQIGGSEAVEAEDGAVRSGIGGKQ